MRKMKKGFFENLETGPNANKEKNEIIPFEFSKEVKDGKKKIIVDLSKK